MCCDCDSGGAPFNNGERLFRMPAHNLPSKHLEALAYALKKILATDTAELTFAQILDGLPVSEVEKDGYNGTCSVNHPLHESHKEPYPGTLRRVKNLRRGFVPGDLKFTPELIAKFGGTAPGTTAFNLRLLELAASAVHRIATQLYMLRYTTYDKDRPRDADSVERWKPGMEDRQYWKQFPNGAPKTLLRHGWYCDYAQYPDHVADGVGYWAESRIFGGVVLFDRRKLDEDALAITGPAVDPDAVYFHSWRKGSTYRIWKLLESQKETLFDFLLSEEQGTAGPLPVLSSRDNVERVDPEESPEKSGIYRDKWERRALDPNAEDVRVKDVWDELNWPSWDEWQASMEAALERRMTLRNERVQADEKDEE